MSMALSGTNKKTQANIISSSRSLSYSIYDTDLTEIPVTNQNNPIHFWISKDPTVPVTPFSFINTTIVTNTTSTSNDSVQLLNGFVVTGLILSGSNVSLHIQLKPINTSLSYLILVKFGDNPILDEGVAYYDALNLYCPNDLLQEGNDSFYLSFFNLSSVNGFKGYVGISIKEINSEGLYCANKSLNSIDTITNKIKALNNTSNFWLRIFAAGCYYTNPITFEWLSDGMEILSDTNVTHTHCITNHLTTFAGGFIVLPPAIEFNNVWAHASFLDNPVIYSTVIALVSVYILLAIWARYMDIKDKKKLGITLLSDGNNINEKYAYEIIVFTGSRMNAGTKSKVVFLI